MCHHIHTPIGILHKACLAAIFEWISCLTGWGYKDIKCVKVFWNPVTSIPVSKVEVMNKIGHCLHLFQKKTKKKKKGSVLVS